EKAGEDFRLLVLSDHKTLTSTRGHDADPVPYLLYDSRNTGRAGGVPGYTEANAGQGPFLPQGHLLICRLFDEDPAV
ncbi:phosphoglycerate mutase, partial [Ruminococcaceae bacterium OttesenSCG-928-I18]|nr:phosphoglycerate mutase [Ruminococcaceae bacterium OttesenSCG-928-I18]